MARVCRGFSVKPIEDPSLKLITAQVQFHWIISTLFNKAREKHVIGAVNLLNGNGFP